MKPNEKRVSHTLRSGCSGHHNSICLARRVARVSVVVTTHITQHVIPVWVISWLDISVWLNHHSRRQAYQQSIDITHLANFIFTKHEAKLTILHSNVKRTHAHIHTNKYKLNSSTYIAGIENGRTSMRPRRFAIPMCAPVSHFLTNGDEILLM